MTPTPSSSARARRTAAAAAAVAVTVAVAVAVVDGVVVAHHAVVLASLAPANRADRELKQTLVHPKET